nr:MAG TPA: hypothetical protein [Caudoviricetes sp.]
MRDRRSALSQGSGWRNPQRVCPPGAEVPDRGAWL